jgi:hypothetical protein
MHSLEEKNHLSNELERTKKRMEDAIQAKVSPSNNLELVLMTIPLSLIMTNASKKIFANGNLSTNILSKFYFSGRCSKRTATWSFRD